MKEAKNQVVIAAVITAVTSLIVGFSAGRAGQEVTINLPDSQTESLSLKAAGDRIERLSKEVASARAEAKDLKTKLDSCRQFEDEEPSPTTGDPPIPRPQASIQKLSGNGFDFLLDGCRTQPSEFSCHLRISNLKEDRKMLLLARSSRWGTSTFLYDGSGAEHSATRAQIGNSGEAHANFITGIEYKASFTFQGVPPGTDRLPVLDIGYVVYRPSGASDGGVQRVKFREAALMR